MSKTQEQLTAEIEDLMNFLYTQGCGNLVDSEVGVSGWTELGVEYSVEWTKRGRWVEKIEGEVEAAHKTLADLKAAWLEGQD